MDDFGNERVTRENRNDVMVIDARNLPAGSRLGADICIIGAGPAGLALARELIGLDLDVLLLESGGPEPEDSAQALNDGTITGDNYAGLRSTRQRAIGGSLHAWNTTVRGEPGAKYVPLDPVDFEEQPRLPLSGWPFSFAHLEPYYRRAQIACGLGNFSYESRPWADARRPVIALAGDRVTTRIYQFGTARAFMMRNLAEVRSADNIRLYYHATACTLQLGGSRNVRSTRIMDDRGRPFDVHASNVVLAAGAIENARLLLVSGEAANTGSDHAWLGRCFMEHPRDYALTWVPRTPDLFREAAFYDAHPAQDDTVIGGRLALTGSAIRLDGLPNASVTLLPRLRPPSASRSTSRRALEMLRRLGRRHAQEGYGWSDQDNPGAIFDAFRLIINVEQRPQPDNRVMLGATRDIFGIPHAELHWRWCSAEQAELQRLRTTIARAIEDAGLGRIEIRSELRPDPNAHHHAGTTRMHIDPRHGVVDANSRVHGMDNLFVTGASVFPTAGFANPTLTIVALAIRLADLLADLSSQLL